MRPPPRTETHTQAQARTREGVLAPKGFHLIVDADCAWGLSDKAGIKEFMHQVIEVTGLHICHLYVKQFPNGHLPWWKRLLGRGRPETNFGPGITAVGVLSESHLSLHTLPEIDWLYFDLFSCAEFDVASVRSLLINCFGVRNFERWTEIHR